MPIYEKSVRNLMGDMVDELQIQKGQPFTRHEVFSWFHKKYPKIKDGTIAAHLILRSTNAPSRIHHKARPEDDLFFQMDASRFRLYDPTTDPAPIYTAPPTPPGEDGRGDDDEEDEGREFAYESDLRDFLAANLSLLEDRLRLYDDEGIRGIEFPAGNRIIDILALDKDNNYVVIQLKVSRGYDRVVGQLLRYMAWIKRNQATDSQRVRGIIVAREISEDLKLACSAIQAVELFEYALSVSLRRIRT